jgi:hypothetical protein
VLASRPGWSFTLSAAARDELNRLARELVASGRPLRELDPDNCDAPMLRAESAPFARELREGCGVALLRGFPIEGVSARELVARYWVLGTAFGWGVSQNRRGDYLGDVIDLSDQQQSARPFQNGGELIMHRDPVDVVGLMCVRHAKAGGLSRIASALRIHDLMLAECPDLLARLYEGYVYHRLDEDRGDTAEFTPFKVPVYARDAAGNVCCFFIPGPIERAGRKGYPIDARGRAALDTFVACSKREGVYFDMDLRPGDIQFLSNRTVLHGRTDYEDYPELERRRYMMRLWLMTPEWPALDPHQRFLEEEDRCGGGIPANA